MADLQKLVHGEPSWDAKVNKIIEYLESGQAIAGMKISDWSSNGVVLASGFKWGPNLNGYRYVQLPNGKLVETDFKFTVTDHAGLLAEKVITLPDELNANGIALNAGFWSTQSNVYKVRLWNNYVSIYRTDNDSNDKWNGDFYVHTFYLHHD